MITRDQARDLAVYCVARSVRFALGWYWTPTQRAQLVKAEETAMRAYDQHRRARRS